ncbi:MAG: hypothetical protein PHR78_02530 [Eubacteriales bacterium]|nr:hypothetical protein [Eubacteriales bacterium]MDD4323905.1 hypothetical protein [Eubacteriales bacterium]MDD4541029.1 hypothetical protein [Eubacteriales bacterium]
MAGYKHPCVHCGNLIDHDARYCVYCNSRSPFGHLCPTCLKPIEKTQTICSACGRPLFVACPNCGQQTFVEERCQACGYSLLIPCQNKRCGELQFFQNEKCTACGKVFKGNKKRK